MNELQTKVTTATWYVSLDCDCPHCKKSVDLLDYAEFWQEHPELNLGCKSQIDVVCPECGEEFDVKTECQ